MSEKKFEDIYEAWNWLYNHPRFNYNDDNAMDDNLYVSIVKVNPFTESICKDDSLNTEIRVWIETGPVNYINEAENSCYWMHDESLDCGGKTFEEAILELASLVEYYYGDYEEK